jgi:hypothetical protein
MPACRYPGKFGYHSWTTDMLFPFSLDEVVCCLDVAISEYQDGGQDVNSFNIQYMTPRSHDLVRNTRKLRDAPDSASDRSGLLASWILRTTFVVKPVHVIKNAFEMTFLMMAFSRGAPVGMMLLDQADRSFILWCPND